MVMALAPMCLSLARQVSEDAHGTRTPERVVCVDNVRTSVPYVYKQARCTTQGGVCVCVCVAGYYSMLYTGSSTNGNDTANGDYKAITMVKDFLAQGPVEPFVIFLPQVHTIKKQNR